MNASAVRERGDHEGGVVLRRARHQIAEMIGDHERQLPMREDSRLRPARGARREEEPARVVILDGCFPGLAARVPFDQRVVVRTERRVSDRHDETDIRGLARRPDVLGEIALADHCGGAARLRQIGDLARGLAEVGRHPDRAQAKAGEHRLEHLVAVLRLHQDALALGHPVGRQRGRHGSHPPVDLGPCPGRIAPSEADLLPVAASGLTHEMRKVHHPPGYGCNASFRGGAGLAHFWRSRIDT
jgi:hypothetical protein